MGVGSGAANLTPILEPHRGNQAQRSVLCIQKPPHVVRIPGG